MERWEEGGEGGEEEGIYRINTPLLSPLSLLFPHSTHPDCQIVQTPL